MNEGPNIVSGLLSGSSHVQNCRRPMDVYLLFVILLGQFLILSAQDLKGPVHKLQMCKSVLIEFAPST